MNLLKSLYFLIALVIANHLNAQPTDSSKDLRLLYTVIYNEMPDARNVPLIGLVNVAKGTHEGLQLGLVNVNKKQFNGLQLGFISRVGQSFGGSQIGFLNFSERSVVGLQLGFGNHIKDNLIGCQTGFFNVARGNAKGLQFGFVNETRGHFQGLQLGFVNEERQNAIGTQIGFINDVSGRITGNQIGFLNVADTIEGGVPIGFFSFVRRGGYRAIEFTANEMYPLNITFKSGIRSLYSFFQLGLNAQYSQPFSLGAGLGSIVPIKDRWYFNPELSYQSALTSNIANATILSLNVRYTLSELFQIAVGPSVVQSSYSTGVKPQALFKLGEWDINQRNSIHIGARFALTYNLTAF